MTNQGSALRGIRIALSLIILLVLTMSFLSLTTGWPVKVEWVETLQLTSATLAASLTVFATWMVVTLVFGRVYCSTFCPMGTFQDIVSRVRRRRRYSYMGAQNGLRYSVLAVVVACLLTSMTALPALLDPSIQWERACLELIGPAIGWAKGHPVASTSLSGVIVALLTLVIVGGIALRSGRTWCNTFCPIGATLSVVSRHSFFRIDINPDKCVKCHRCEHVCKARCIEAEQHVVDMSRCVVCFDCLECPNDAIKYTMNSHKLQTPLLMRDS